MAKEALRVKQSRGAKFRTRNYSRCSRCGRSRAYFRKFGVCRICLGGGGAAGGVRGL
jgi:small subunit ribosomal protein S14